MMDDFWKPDEPRIFDPSIFEPVTLWGYSALMNLAFKWIEELKVGDTVLIQCSLRYTMLSVGTVLQVHPGWMAVLNVDTSKTMQFNFEGRQFNSPQTWKTHRIIQPTLDMWSRYEREQLASYITDFSMLALASAPSELLKQFADGLREHEAQLNAKVQELENESPVFE